MTWIVLIMTWVLVLMVFLFSRLARAWEYRTPQEKGNSKFLKQHELKGDLGFINSNSVLKT